MYCLSKAISSLAHTLASGPPETLVPNVISWLRQTDREKERMTDNQTDKERKTGERHTDRKRERQR